MTDWKSVLREQSVTGAAVWPLRLFLGFTFLRASWDKLVDPAFFNPAAAGYVGHQLALGASSSPLGGLLTGFIVPNATLFGMLTMAGELLIGLAVLLGWYTRFSAILGLFINLMFYLTITWDVQPYYYGADIVFVVAWLTLVLTGPGPLSVDAYLKQRVQAQPAPAVPARAPASAPARTTGAPTRTPILASTPTRTPISAAAPTRTSGATSTGTRAAGAPTRPASSPPARPGARTDSATRLAPEPRPANRQVGGRASKTPGVLVTGMTRRQFNVLGLSAFAAAALGLLEMAAWPVLHGGSSSAVGTQPGPATPATGSGLAAVPPATPAGQASTAAAAAPHGQQIAAAGQVPAGQAIEFTNPGDGYPAVLVHNDSGYSAYYAICTHQGCQVSYDASAHLIACPCHGAVFDPKANGQVVRGPARQPLQPIAITTGPDGAVYLAG